MILLNFLSNLKLMNVVAMILNEILMKFVINLAKVLLLVVKDNQVDLCCLKKFQIVLPKLKNHKICL